MNKEDIKRNKNIINEFLTNPDDYKSQDILAKKTRVLKKIIHHHSKLRNMNKECFYLRCIDMIDNLDTITVEFLEQLVYFCNESVKRESREYYADTKVIRNELMNLKCQIEDEAFEKTIKPEEDSVF